MAVMASHLESLPTEILEQIFLESLNVNFPLASSSLGTVLSSTRTKMAVVLKFFPSNASSNLEHDTELSQLISAGGSNDTQRAIGELQSRILSCRWMTWDFLKLCMEEFVVRTLLREFRDQDLPWQEGMPVEGQPYGAAKLPWHGSAPVKESVVKNFVRELFALKVGLTHLEIRYEDMDPCRCTKKEMQISRDNFRKWRKERANHPRTESSSSSRSSNFDSSDASSSPYQCLVVETTRFVETTRWNSHYTQDMIKDEIITSSLRTYSWGPVGGTPRIRIGIGPRNGLVILGTKLAFGPDSDMITIEEMTSCRWRCLWCPFHTNIPVKLLHGPWTEDQLSFLQALIDAGAHLDPGNTTHRDIAKRGLTEAISQDNFRAVDLLITEAMKCPCHPDYKDNYIEPSFGNAKFVMNGGLSDDSRDMVDHLVPRRTLYISPDTEHLKVAVIQRGCRRKIVQRLLWAEKSDIDRTDPTVIGWAESKKEQGDKIGQWLLDQLASSRDKDRYWYVCP